MEPLIKRTLPDGRVIWLWRYLLNWRLQVSLPQDETVIGNEWCYVDEREGIHAASTWDGQGNPPDWFKNPATNTYNEEHWRRQAQEPF